MAIAGLSLGVAALVIVLSVMNGFEKELQTRVLGVVPQLIIRSEESLSNYDDLISKFRNSDNCANISLLLLIRSSYLILTMFLIIFLSSLKIS